MDYQRMAGRLQQRIAEITAEYEGRLVILADEFESRIKQLEKQIEELGGAVVSEESNTGQSS